MFTKYCFIWKKKYRSTSKIVQVSAIFVQISKHSGLGLDMEVYAFLNLKPSNIKNLLTILAISRAWIWAFLAWSGSWKNKEPFWSFKAPNNALPWLNQVPEIQPFWRFQAPYINQPCWSYKAPELNK